MVSFLFYLQNIEELQSIINTQCLTTNISKSTIIEIKDEIETKIYLCLDDAKCICGHILIESIKIEEKALIMKISKISLYHIQYDLFDDIQLKSEIDIYSNK